MEANLQALEERNNRDRVIALERDVENMRSEIAEMKHDLFGNGQPGILAEIKTKLGSHDRLIWIGMGIIMAIQLLAAQGWLSIFGHTVNAAK